MRAPPPPIGLQADACMTPGGRPSARQCNLILKLSRPTLPMITGEPPRWWPRELASGEARALPTRFKRRATSRLENGAAELALPCAKKNKTTLAVAAPSA